MGKIAAVIPAAGYSKRMHLYKPLLPLVSSLVIEKPIMTFYEAGIEDIRVVVGHKAELLKPVLRRLGVQVVVNENYDRGMYSSIKAGIKTLAEEIEAFFLLPADYAFVDSLTIRQLIQANAEGDADVIYPVLNGRKGHPPLISASLKETILAGEPEGGLKELLKEKAMVSLEIPVGDPGVMIDLDSEEDYIKIIQDKLALFPSYEECLKILKEYNTESMVLNHVQEVARIAGIISEHLNSSGLRINLGLVMASSLLHDIAKGERDHPNKGKQIAAGLNYPEVADIIASHMELPADHARRINEHSVVYLADKMVQGSRFVSLEKKFRQKMDKYKEDAVVQQNVLRRMLNALFIKQSIENVLNMKLEDIQELKSESGEEHDEKGDLSGKTCRTRSAG